MCLLKHSGRIEKCAKDWCSELLLHTLGYIQRNNKLLFNLILLLSKYISCRAL